MYLSFLLRTYFADARATKKCFIDTLLKYGFKKETTRKLYEKGKLSKHTQIFISGNTWEEYVTVVTKNSLTYSPKLFKVQRDICESIKTISDFKMLLTSLHAWAPMKQKTEGTNDDLCKGRRLLKIASVTWTDYKSTTSKRITRGVKKFGLKKFHRFQTDKDFGNFQIENAYYFDACDYIFNKYNALIARGFKRPKNRQRTVLTEFRHLTSPERMRDSVIRSKGLLHLAYSSLRERY